MAWPWDKLKWYRKHYPELANLPQDTQARLVKASVRGVWKSTRYWLVFLPTFVLWMLWIHESYAFLPDGWLGHALHFTGISGFALFVGFYFPKLSVGEQKRWLQQELNRQGVRPACCLRCGYDLRGTPDESTACPECGGLIAAVGKREMANDECTNGESMPK